jgi:hypothetical protein
MGRSNRSSQVGLAPGAAVMATGFGSGWMHLEADKSPPVQKPASAIPAQTTVVEPSSVELTRSGLGTVIAWNAPNDLMRHRRH